MSKCAGPFEAGTNNQGQWVVLGPAEGHSYHSGLGYPENGLPDYAMAEKVSDMMNRAFAAGRQAKAREIRMALECKI